MHISYMNTLDNKYLDLVKDIIENGFVSGDRTGTGTKKVFGRQIRHNMQEGFPLLTSKKMYTKGIIHELLWFLRGETNIKYLIDNDCHIWDGDAYKNYLKAYNNGEDVIAHVNMVKSLNPEDKDKNRSPLSLEEFVEFIKNSEEYGTQEFVKKYADLGPIYGKQWRSWGGIKQTPISYDKGLPTKFKIENKFDQIEQLIRDLKNNPDSRRLMVNAWNVGELDEMVLPPCHYGFQCFTRELSLEERIELVNPIPNLFTHEDCDTLNLPRRAISLMWNQRSCDFLLGIPFNLASYGFLLEMIAQVTNMIPEELIGNFGDCHVYLNQIEFFNEQLNNKIYDLPKLVLNKEVKDIFNFNFEDIIIENYSSSKSIKYPLSN